MFKAVKNKYLIDQAESFKVEQQATVSTEEHDIASLKKELKAVGKELADLQHRLFAEDKRSLLVIFQAMDAAGKDSTIRAVFKYVNPAGCQVFSFKQPSKQELDHDFLWRSAVRLPERGRIGIFNRSYYEEALVVRVHPEYLRYQRLHELPQTLYESSLSDLWQQRFESYNDHEKHLARNGTVVLKFWLNVSQQEQHNRFLSRLDEPEKNWKFSSGDLDESALWSKYMNAYQDVISHTSKPWAPWYVIPADNKRFMRLQVAKTLLENLKAMDPQYPKADKSEIEKFDEMRERLAQWKIQE